MTDTVVKVENISKKFCRSLKKSLWYGMKDLGSELIGYSHGGNEELRPDEFWAVKDVSFELKRGECLGLIGRNGAGKTTLLRMLNGLIKPDKGRIEMRGRVGALIALGAGFNPILTGRENIYVNASVLGLKKKDIDAKFDEIVDFAELGEFIDAPVQSYSSGMAVRLGFAIAVNISPDILLLDEVLAVGDLQFRKKCYSAVGKIKKECATIIVSHNLSHLSQIADNGIVLGRGSTNQYKVEISNALNLYTSPMENNFTETFYKGMSESITNIQIISPPISLKLLDDLVIEYDIESNKSESFNLRLFIRDTSEDIIAEWSSFYFAEPIKISFGHTRIKFKWEKNRLASGHYTSEIIIYERNGLEVAASLTNSNYIFVNDQHTGPAKIFLGVPRISYS